MKYFHLLIDSRVITEAHIFMQSFDYFSALCFSLVSTAQRSRLKAFQGFYQICSTFAKQNLDDVSSHVDRHLTGHISSPETCARPIPASKV